MPSLKSNKMFFNYLFFCCCCWPRVKREKSGVWLRSIVFYELLSAIIFCFSLHLRFASFEPIHIQISALVWINIEEKISSNISKHSFCIMATYSYIIHIIQVKWKEFCAAEWKKFAWRERTKRAREREKKNELSKCSNIYYLTAVRVIFLNADYSNTTECLFMKTLGSHSQSSGEVQMCTAYLWRIVCVCVCVCGHETIRHIGIISKAIKYKCHERHKTRLIACDLLLLYGISFTFSEGVICQLNGSRKKKSPPFISSAFFVSLGANFLSFRNDKITFANDTNGIVRIHLQRTHIHAVLFWPTIFCIVLWIPNGMA